MTLLWGGVWLKYPNMLSKSKSGSSCVCELRESVVGVHVMRRCYLIMSDRWCIKFVKSRKFISGLSLCRLSCVRLIQRLKLEDSQVLILKLNESQVAIHEDFDWWKASQWSWFRFCWRIKECQQIERGSLKIEREARRLIKTEDVKSQHCCDSIDDSINIWGGVCQCTTSVDFILDHDIHCIV